MSECTICKQPIRGSVYRLELTGNIITSTPTIYRERKERHVRCYCESCLKTRTVILDLFK